MNKEYVMSSTKKKATLKRWYKHVYDKCTRKAKNVLTDKKKISQSIKKARKIFERLHNLPRFESFANNICNFCDLLSDYFDGSYKNLPLATVVAALGGLLYVILPFDCIADFMPLIGWTDDIAVLAFVIKAEQNDVKEYLNWKKDNHLNELTNGNTEQ